MQFAIYTNSTLIDEEFCQDMLRVGNFIPAISLEGFEEANDSRRGEGVYDKVTHAMALLKQHHLPFGICRQRIFKIEFKQNLIIFHRNIIL